MGAVKNDNGWRCNCATDLPRRETYEGRIGGWPDGRLGQAYDLIDAIMNEQSPQNEGYASLKRARELVEESAR